MLSPHKLALTYVFFLSLGPVEAGGQPRHQAAAAASGYVMPKFDWRTSKIFGQSRPNGFYSDWWQTLRLHGEVNTGEPQYHIVGIRGSCGDRVDSIQFVYKKGNDPNLYGKICGDSNGAMNPPIGSSGTWGYNAVDVAAGEYISEVEVYVCKHENSNRLCYLHFKSNKGKTIMDCGKKPKSQSLLEVVDSDIYPGKRGRLYSAQGHAGDEVDMMQLIWVRA